VLGCIVDRIGNRLNNETPRRSNLKYTHLSELAPAHSALSETELRSAATAYAHLFQDLGPLRLPLSITAVDPSFFAIPDRSLESIRDCAEDDVLLVLLQERWERDLRSIGIQPLRGVRGLSDCRQCLRKVVDLGGERVAVDPVGSE